jgi:hypothetical protein
MRLIAALHDHLRRFIDRKSTAAAKVLGSSPGAKICALLTFCVAVTGMLSRNRIQPGAL